MRNDKLLSKNTEYGKLRQAHVNILYTTQERKNHKHKNNSKSNVAEYAKLYINGDTHLKNKSKVM